MNTSGLFRPGNTSARGAGEALGTGKRRGFALQRRGGGLGRVGGSVDWRGQGGFPRRRIARTAKATAVIVVLASFVGHALHGAVKGLHALLRLEQSGLGDHCLYRAQDGVVVGLKTKRHARVLAATRLDGQGVQPIRGAARGRAQLERRRAALVQSVEDLRALQAQQPRGEPLTQHRQHIGRTVFLERVRSADSYVRQQAVSVEGAQIEAAVWPEQSVNAEIAVVRGFAEVATVSPFGAAACIRDRESCRE